MSTPILLVRVSTHPTYLYNLTALSIFSIIPCPFLFFKRILQRYLVILLLTPDTEDVEGLLPKSVT